MKRIFSLVHHGFFAAAMIVTLLPIGGPVQAQQPIELSLGHVNPTDYQYHIAAVAFAKEVQTRSAGTMQVNLFPSAQLGGEVKMIQGTRTGTQDLVITASGPLENTAREFAVWSFPYLFKDYDHAHRIMQSAIGHAMLAGLDKHGLIGLGFIAPVERNIFTNGKRITRASDMAGLKIRVIQGPSFVKTYEALGAQPTPMAYSELYTALQNGTVDAAENGPDNFVEHKLIEVSKTYSMARIMYMPSVMLMSASRYRSLTPEQQAIIRAAAAVALETNHDAYKQIYDKNLQRIKDSDIELIEPDLDSFRTTKAAVHASLLSSMPQTRPWYEKIMALQE